MPKTRKTTTGRRGARWGKAIVVCAAVAAFAAGSWAMWGVGPNDVLADGPERPGATPETATYRGLPVVGTSIGNPNAPVTVEEYFDFRCPHCKTAAEQVVDPLIERYVRDGDVVFTYRFFPILGPDSIMAARGAYCAAREDRFWPYQDILFDQQGKGGTSYAPDSLAAYAASVGLDADTFFDCVASDESYGAVARSYGEGRRLQLPGTPTFVVNGDVLQRISLKAVETAVQEALGEATN